MNWHAFTLGAGSTLLWLGCLIGGCFIRRRWLGVSVIALACLLYSVAIMRAEDALKPAPLCDGKPCSNVASSPELDRLKATVQTQQQLIQALQAKIAALLAYMNADETIRSLQQPVKPQVNP